MIKIINKVPTAAQRWPELHKIAMTISSDVLKQIRSINTENNPQITEEAKDCMYFQQSILESVISDLEKFV